MNKPKRSVKRVGILPKGAENMFGVNQQEIGQGEKCGNCQFFNRWQWDEAYGGGQQRGGDCSHLLDVIRLTNAKLWALDRLHVQESFGCSLYRKAE